MSRHRRSGSTRKYRRMREIALFGATHCWLCGRPFTDPRDPPVADHFWPVSAGGTDHPSNLKAEHKRCNLRRGGRLPTELGQIFPYHRRVTAAWL